MGDLMLDLPALPAPQRAALYRQLAANLREAAVDGMDDQFRSDFQELAREYDARAADIWPPEIPGTHRRARRPSRTRIGASGGDTSAAGFRAATAFTISRNCSRTLVSGIA